MINQNLEKLKEISAKLASGEISPTDVAGLFSSTSNPLPSDAEIAKNGKEFENTLKPVPLILTDHEVNELICSYSGEELGNHLIWSILRKQGDLTNINNLPDFKSNTNFDNFLNGKKLSNKLQAAKEMISDNLDLNPLGILIKGANLKVRDYSVGPFSFKINVITSRGTPLFFHVAPPPLDVKGILNRIEERIKKSPNKKCSSDFSKKYNSPVVDEDLMLKTLKDIITKADNLKNVNNVFDLIDDVFCEPNIPINPETGNPLFTQEALNKFLKDICIPAPETHIEPPLPTTNPADISSAISECLDQTKSIFKDIREKNELKSRYQKAEGEIQEVLYHYQIIQNYYNGLYNAYINKIADKKTIPNTNTTIYEVFTSTQANNFIKAVKDFSCRIRKTNTVGISLIKNASASYQGIKFEFEYSTGLGKPIPHQTIKTDLQNTLISQNYQTVDISKLELGMEFSDGGLFNGFNHDFFSSLGNSLVFHDSNPKLNSDFYSFASDIQNTNKTKDQIINSIRKDHGYLYSNLLEVSGSPWLFFTAQERGDNDARKTEDIKPASKDAEGNPSKEFNDFWGNFKTAWDKKYNSRKAEIESKILEIKGFSDGIADLMANYYLSPAPGKATPSSDSVKATLKKDSDNINARVDSIQKILLEIGTQLSKLDQDNSPSVLQSKVGAIKCSLSPAAQGMTAECPSACCGPSGQAIDAHGLSGNANSADCPSIYTTCYWKEFCKKLNTVGTLPFPSGLPPIENPMPYPIGLKYWPVGYLPPSFIPLPPPLFNPLDGMPFLRIPLPMVWTVIDPIIIPLPIGLMVIFIPFVGGFMPSPLVFFHDFLTNNSIFLLGLRGFRFIPKKSDPKIEDVLKEYKKSLSRGVPNYMFPFANLGKDNVDGPDRILKDILANLTKQASNVNKDFDFSEIQKIQDEIAAKKKEYDDKILEAKRRSALENTNYKQYEAEIKSYLSSLDKRKISAVMSAINDYLSNLIDVPDVQFPKQSKNLIAEIPSVVRIPMDISNKKKIGTIPKISSINLKSRILSSLKQADIEAPSEFDSVNKNLSDQSKIVAQLDVPLGQINTDQASLDKLSKLVSNHIGGILNSDKSPLSSKSLLLFKPSLSSIPKIGGSQIPLPSSLNDNNDPRILALKSHIAGNTNISSRDIINLANSNSIAGNKVIRKKDLKMISGNVLEKILNNYPDNLKKFTISGQLDASEASMLFGSFSSSIEVPPFPPKKSGTEGVPIGIGGIPSIIIPGSAISSFIKKGAKSLVESQDYNKLIPGGLDGFSDLTKDDIKTMGSNLAIKFTSTASIPGINSLPEIPLKSRPQDFVEFVMNFLPVHPFSDVAFTIQWNKYKSPPRIPISGDLLLEYIKLQDSIFSKLPWPVVAILGRNIINLINPLYNREDLPRWDRMSLKNPFFVVFLDEFLRSATDISGGFKYFIGGPPTGLIYPLPDLEIYLGFGTTIDIN